ncbi:MAG: hypothetical protein SVM80_09090 [Halobacteriota archaeon]|nr:hypothetical protein [Halobacteriota archaeon]
MKISDTMKRPRGIFHICANPERVYSSLEEAIGAGEEIESVENKIVNAGMQQIGDILAGVETTNITLTQFGVGSGSTTSAYTDTSLETEIGKVTGQITGYPYRTSNVVYNSWVVDDGFLEGTWREVGTFFGDDVMFCHINVTERAKSSGDILQVWYEYDVTG